MTESDHAMSPEDIRLYMMGVHPGMAEHRRRFKHIPSEPRCKLCMVPFGGIGGAAFRVRGFGRSSNPMLCSKCTVELAKNGLTGVEIPCTLLFSDIRGSTALGEKMRPTEFHAFLNSFYKLATRAIVDHDGLVDKLVGDEVIGLFFGGVSGPDHAGAGIRAALDLADHAADRKATPMGAIPVGTAVHTGDAFVGATALNGSVDDFTALGDTVNTTARLASAAGPGEVLVSNASAAEAHLAVGQEEHRVLNIRGRTEPIEVVVLRHAASDALT